VKRRPDPLHPDILLADLKYARDDAERREIVREIIRWHHLLWRQERAILFGLTMLAGVLLWAIIG
jgi:hypothetical protein